MTPNLCIKCKGKGLCGRPRCPILEKFKSIESVIPKSSGETSIFGASPPSVFVGRYNYPEVRAGPMIPPQLGGDEAMLLEDPKALLKMNIQDVISSRSQLVRANTGINVKNAHLPDNPLIERSQELALSKKPVDTEAWFNKPISNKLKFDNVLTPMGPSGDLKKFDITENPKVPKKVDALVYDTDALAKDAISELWDSNIPAEHITRLLSIGLLGQERKLVPTRWSITAVDDMVGKDLLRGIRDYQQLSEVQVFNGGVFGNHFEIVLIPRMFSFELIEVWMPRTVWSGGNTWIEADNEGFSGKKNYSNLAGGYYAARLGALEYLHSIHRQATVFMVREIRPEYWAPLGVWVVREGVRKAFNSEVRRFESVELALADISMRLNTSSSQWMPKTSLLPDIRFQRTLDSFFK
ncbi:Nre family DNA repair protein [Methanolobus psychrotolerans]|uniref:Nre family DNA repair protein n=1 Tax=Methanolobus psychrotolerans TaxID=1874706 RepID=UPI000B915D30|nr:Nre family DNA repair protein [Methanolobus psychrotolerans]